MIMGDNKKHENLDVVKSYQSSDLIGGSSEILVIRQGHPTMTTSGSLTMGESNPFRTTIN
jgi:hypothetical protein